MEKKMQFQKKANVIAANGESIGHIDRIVLNPATKVITDLVIRKGALFNMEDKVVPITFVAETTESQVVLRNEAGDLDAFPSFEKKQVVARTEDEGPLEIPTNVQQPVHYGLPEVGPAFVPASNHQFNTRVEQNIPEGTVAMKEGAKVITSDGKHVGHVERIFTDASVDQITHLLISQGVFVKDAKLIPIAWVMTLGEEEVHLRVNKEMVEESEDVSMTV